MAWPRGWGPQGRQDGPELGSFSASFPLGQRFGLVVVVGLPRHSVLGPESRRSRCERPFHHDSSPGRLELRDRARTWIGNENAGWRRFRGKEEGLPNWPREEPKVRGLGRKRERGLASLQTVTERVPGHSEATPRLSEDQAGGLEN